MKIFLDDLRTLDMSHNLNKGLGEMDGKSWLIARTLQDFKSIIINHFNDIDLISFDHDLGIIGENGEEEDGKDAANFLVDYCMDNGKKLPDWYVHSDNTVGVENISGLLFGYMKNVENQNIIYSKYNRGYVNGVVI